jgi:membrane-associated protease RseP (regulator of RpoE activity)
MDLYFISVLLFFFVLGLLIYKDRKNVEFKYILFLRRTKKFKKFIDKIAKKSPLFWKILGTIAIVVCFYYMIQGVYIILLYQPSLQIVVPTPTSKGAVGPGYILIPFWFWIVVVGSILVPHELLHGIIARAEKVRLKSVGLLLLAIFPGAFVEPDEKQIKKASLLTKLRIFSAGSFANFIVSFAIFYLTSYLIWPLCASQGIILLNVTPSSPAEVAGLRGGMLITEVNGKPIIPT